VLLMGLRPSEDQLLHCEDPKFDRSLARWDMSLESRSCMRAHWPAGKPNTSSLQGTMSSTMIRAMSPPIRFSVNQRVHPYLPCPKQAWTLCL